MEELVSNKGSQTVKVERGRGVVVIRTYDTKIHIKKSVTIFDELLPGLIARLVASARPAPLNNEMKQQGKGRRVSPKTLRNEDK